MWPFRTILYFLCFWLGCFAALVNPIWGVVNYVMAYQMNPPITWWGTPLVNIGMRFSMLAIGFTLLGLITGRRHVPDARPRGSMWELGVLGLIAIAVLAIPLGIGYSGTAQYAFEKFWKLQVFVLILVRLVTTRRNLKLLIWAIVGGSFYLGYDAFTAPYRSFLLGRLEAFGGPDISTSSGASAHLVAMLPIIGIAFLISKQWKWKIAAAITGGFTFNAVVLCRTRSAFVGLLCGLIAAVLMAPRTRRYRIYSLLAVGSVVAFSLTDSNFRERMNTLTTRETLDKDEAVVARVDIVRAATEMLSDHPMGVGLGNFSRIIGQYDSRHRNRSPHNTLVMAFCELGILGGLLFMAICAESVRLIYKCSRLANQTGAPLETKLIAYGLLVSVVSYLVAGLGTERFSCESFWWVLALPLCLYRIVYQEIHVPVSEPVPALQPALAEHVPAWRSPQYG